MINIYNAYASYIQYPKTQPVIPVPGITFSDGSKELKECGRQTDWRSDIVCNAEGYSQSSLEVYMHSRTTSAIFPSEKQQTLTSSIIATSGEMAA